MDEREVHLGGSAAGHPLRARLLGLKRERLCEHAVDGAQLEPLPTQLDRLWQCMRSLQVP